MYADEGINRSSIGIWRASELKVDAIITHKHIHKLYTETSLRNMIVTDKKEEQSGGYKTSSRFISAPFFHKQTANKEQRPVGL